VPALLAVAWLSLLYGHASASAQAYDSAPWCSTLPSTADHHQCRYGLSATVTEVHMSSGKGASYWMALRGVPPADGRITFAADADVLDIAGIGDTVHVEVWRDRVVRVELDGYSDATAESPSYPARRALAWLIAAVAVAATLLAVGAGQRYGPWGRRWYRGAVGGLGIAAVGAVMAAAVIMVDPTATFLAYAIPGLLLAFGVPIAAWRRWRGILRQLPTTASNAPASKRRSRRQERDVWPARRAGSVAGRSAAATHGGLRRTLRTAWRLGIPAAVAGLLATAATALALAACVRTVQSTHAYERSPVCAEPVAQSDGQCRRTVVATVWQVRVVDGKDAESWLYLSGSSPADGEIDFRGSGPVFLRNLAVGDVVRAEVWRGRVTAVSAAAGTGATADAPGEALDGAVAALSLAFVAALILLRGSVRVRRRQWGWRAMGTPVVEIGVVAVAAAGVVLLGFGVPWGAAAVGLALAALLYTTAVPTVARR
jgi:hypothetical protein